MLIELTNFQINRWFVLFGHYYFGRQECYSHCLGQWFLRQRFNYNSIQPWTCCNLLREPRFGWFVEQRE